MRRWIVVVKCGALWKEVHRINTRFSLELCNPVELRGESCGGWGGIRTHEELAPPPVFKTGAFNRSATHPYQSIRSYFFALKPCYAGHCAGTATRCKPVRGQA